MTSYKGQSVSFFDFGFDRKSQVRYVFYAEKALYNWEMGFIGILRLLLLVT